MMGLLQKAVETFDAHQALVGKEREGHRPLAPVSHTVKNAAIEITLNERGEIQDVGLVDKGHSMTVIPVTEASVGRTQKAAPHPLCELSGYLSGENEEKFTLYVEQLGRWAESEFSHPMLKPILTYVMKRSLRADLAGFGIELKDDKQLIRWRVNGIGAESGACWTNEGLFRAFDGWYRSVRGEECGEDALCMVSGEVAMPTIQHLKGIVPNHGNAKLISANDKQNFTYRGRFSDPSQVASVSYDASQKAHNALQWLVAEQGSRAIFGGRMFLCWNPKGKEVPHCGLPFGTRDTVAVTPTDYKAELQKTLEGWRVQLPENCGGVLIASFDAATSGRLALTYYNELMASDFLQRLYDWDESCCWWDFNPESGRYDAIRSPSLWTLVNCAYGTQRGEKDAARLETDERVLRQQIQRLVACRVDRAAFPEDLMRALVQRACSPQSFESNVYERILRAACAAVKKYYHDVKKEELPMTLEEERGDRSYLFGRLLAVLDHAEEDFYRKNRKGENERRQTNAMKYMTKFQRRPLEVYMHIYLMVEEAYVPRISPGQQMRFHQRIEEINEELHKIPSEELNRPLKETFLMGFYHQRREFYQSKNETEQEED